MSRLIFAVAPILIIMQLTPASADYYGSYSYSYSSGMGGSEPIVSLSLDPQENLNNGFRLAARQDRLDELRGYLKEGADINSVSDDRETALMISARSCSPKLVHFLLESGADANLQDKLGRTALMFAAGGDCLPVVEQLTATPQIKIRLRDHENRSAVDYAGYDFRIIDRLRAAKRHESRRATEP